MALTALNLPSHALKRYRPTRRLKSLPASNSKRMAIANRRRRALLTARKAAELLRSEFSAKKVFIFGSLTRRGGFTNWSDIDIAAKGISPSRFYEAVGAISGLSHEFKIDLIDIETSPKLMRKVIEVEGKSL